jgi:hypothetical protein
VKTTNTTTPTLHLEQARLGERSVSDVDAPAVAALREDDDAFLEAMPAALAVPQVQAEARRRAAVQQTKQTTSSTLSLRWPRWLAVGAVPACAAAALVVSLQRAPEPRPIVDDTSPEVVRPKGVGAQLVATHVTAEGAAPLANGARLSAGDVVQLGWQVSSTASSAVVHGVVVSIDGRGTVTQHLPLPPSTAAPVLSARGLLPSSYELDDAPYFERFFLVTGAAIDVDAVLQAARVLAAGEAPETKPLVLPSIDVSDVLVRK